MVWCENKTTCMLLLLVPHLYWPSTHWYLKHTPTYFVFHTFGTWGSGQSWAHPCVPPLHTAGIAPQHCSPPSSAACWHQGWWERSSEGCSCGEIHLRTTGCGWNGCRDMMVHDPGEASSGMSASLKGHPNSAWRQNRPVWDNLSELPTKWMATKCHLCLTRWEQYLIKDLAREFDANGLSLSKKTTTNTFEQCRQSTLYTISDLKNSSKQFSSVHWIQQHMNSLQVNW